MKKIFIRLMIGLVILGGMGALVLEFMNWNQFKPPIKSQVQKMTGRALEIEGDLKLSLFPTPKIVAHGLKFENAPQGKVPHMVTLQKVKVGIDVFSLIFSKRLSITKVILESPVIHIEKYVEGGNWILPASIAASTTLAQEVSSPKTASKEDQKFQVAIDRAEVSNGTITYGEGNTLTTLTDVKGKMSMKSLEGPYILEGSLKMKGNPYTLKIKTEKFPQEEKMPTQLTVGHPWGDLTFEGALNPSQKQALGKIQAKIVGIGIKEPVTLRGSLKASETEISLSDFILQEGSHEGTGQMHLTLSPSLKIKADLKSLLGQASLKVEESPHGKETQGNVSIQSHNLYELLSLAGLGDKVKNLQKKSIFKGRSNFTYSKTLGVHLKSLHLALNEVSLKGNLSVRTLQKGHAATLDLSLNSLKALLNLMGIKSPYSLDSLRLKGTLSGTPALVKVQQTLSVLDGTLSFSGTVSNLMSSLAYDMIIKAQNLNLSQILKNVLKPSQKLFLSTRVRGSLSHIEISQINLRLASIKALGSISYDRSSPRPLLKADLTIPQGNFMDLLAVSSASNQASSSSNPDSNAARNRTNTVSLPQQVSQKTSRDKSSHWSREPLNRAFLKNTDLDISLTAHDMSLKSLPIGKAIMRLKADKGTVTFSKQADMAGGKLTIDLSGKIQEKITAEMQLYLKNASLNQLALTVGNFKDLEGTGTLQFAGKTQGHSQYDLVSNLNGKGDIKTQNAVLRGWDIKSLNQSIGSLQGLTKSLTFDKMMDKIKDKEKKKQTKFSLTSSFSMNQGVASSTDTKLVGTGISMDGKGRLNLPQWTLDATALVFLTSLDPKNGIPAYARGSLDNLSYGMETAQLMKYIYTKFLKGTVEKALGLKEGSPLGKLLGLDSSKEPSSKENPQATKKPLTSQKKGSPSSSQNIEKAIGNVLGTLLGN